MGDTFIVPAPAETEGFTSLSRTAQGKVFRKHILNLGTLIHPQTGERMNLDEAWYGKLKANFDAKVCPIVQVPLADDQNKHSEAPDRNLGEVLDIERDGKKIYAVMDIRDEDAAKKVGKTLLGSSAFLHMNYTDTRTGKKVGPTLLHNCVTNRPYVTDLDEYEPVLAASDVIEDEAEILEFAAPSDSGPSADKTGDKAHKDEEPPVPMTKEELLAELKASHGIDVEALIALAAKPEPKQDSTELANVLVQALTDSGVVKLSNDDGAVDNATLVGSVLELAAGFKQQGEEIGALKLSAAESEVDGYIDAGRAFPKSRATLVRLAMEDRDAMESLLAPEGKPLVPLSDPKGVPGDAGQVKQDMDIDAEMAKLSAEHPEFFGGR
jgi:hypothetical protein